MFVLALQNIVTVLSSEMDLFIEQNHRNILGLPGYGPVVCSNTSMCIWYVYSTYTCKHYIPQ